MSGRSDLRMREEWLGLQKLQGRAKCIVGVWRGQQPHGSGATSWGRRSPRWGEMGLWEALRAQLQASELGVG